MNITAKQIDALLPQTQCTQCGYNGCLPYAEAIAKGVLHNQCPPGGTRTIHALAQLLNREVLPLNPNNGIEQPKKIAKIREIDCIGCTKCIQACPTDAILGAAKQMHTVIESECTGCGLCVAPCPMDCIEMIEAPESMQPALQNDQIREKQRQHYRQRHYFRNARLVRMNAEHKALHALKKSAGKSNSEAAADAKKAYIKAALARVKMSKLVKKS